MSNSSMMARILANLYIAIDAVLSNKVRSLLTALGIIFGVAAVIAMLAIGNGAQQEILEQIKLVGVNNIVIKPVVEQEEEKVEEVAGQKEKKKFSPGLTLRDVESLTETLPGLTYVSPEIILETNVVRQGYRRSAKLVGVDPSYFTIYNFVLEEGMMFTDIQRKTGAAVCIIGQSIKTRFFPTENPLGKNIKVGPHWLTIVGVLEERFVSQNSISKLGIRDFNMDVYVPLQTMLIRYRDRAKITASELRLAAARSRSSGTVGAGGSAADREMEYYRQLDRLVIQVGETQLLWPTAEIL